MFCSPSCTKTGRIKCAGCRKFSATAFLKLTLRLFRLGREGRSYNNIGTAEQKITAFISQDSRSADSWTRCEAKTPGVERWACQRGHLAIQPKSEVRGDRQSLKERLAEASRRTLASTKRRVCAGVSWITWLTSATAVTRCCCDLPLTARDLVF